MANSKVAAYFRESYDELMHKVSWPTWSELQSSAIVVSIASLIIALVVFLLLVKLVGMLMKKKEEAPGPATTKTCPECLETVPLAATRCKFCTSKLEA